MARFHHVNSQRSQACELRLADSVPGAKTYHIAFNVHPICHFNLAGPLWMDGSNVRIPRRRVLTRCMRGVPTSQRSQYLYLGRPWLEAWTRRHVHLARGRILSTPFEPLYSRMSVLLLTTIDPPIIAITRCPDTASGLGCDIRASWIYPPRLLVWRLTGFFFL